MTGLLLILGAALAGGMHSGIPVKGVPGVGAPSFESAEAGWSALLDDGQGQTGVVRVFVGQTEEEAADWLGRTAMAMTRTPAAYPHFGDEALGDGDGLLMFRDGNVAAQILVSAGARSWGDQLRSAIVNDGSAWPAAPRLEPQADGTWAAKIPSSSTLSASGGRIVPGQGDRFSEAPRELVLWDRYGRAAVWRAEP